MLKNECLPITQTLHPIESGSDGETFEAGCVELFASIAASLSIPRSLGQIYGLLFSCPHPMVFSEIVERLQISKGSVSQGLALLKALGAVVEIEAEAVTEISVGRSRALAGNGRPARVAYEPELSLRRLVGGMLRKRVAPLAAVGVDRLHLLKSLAHDEKQNREFCLDRVRQLEGWRRRVKTVIPVMVTLLGARKE